MYMGRWSRLMAAAFLDWLRPEPRGRWLEFGCGTGALTAAIRHSCAPETLVACDPSEAFVGHARARLPDQRVSFLVADAGALPRLEGGFDAVVSGLVLNFVSDPGAALAAVRARLRPGGVAAAYVWDYAEGMEFLRIFWDEAAALDERAAALDEGVRFPLCRGPALAELFREAGLGAVRCEAIEVVTEFASFEDYWSPFLHGTGPAPAFVATLAPREQHALRDRLAARLTAERDGRIRLRARAWAVRGTAPGPAPAGG
ncbi:MAG: class I SAM-dependent methyltransferase [Candidatus Eisenbacteria bacterium]|nr:class I SAM-dependent methyltransferase [Candidatus Eisenbacteria bacterium]